MFADLGHFSVRSIQAGPIGYSIKFVRVHNIFLGLNNQLNVMKPTQLKA